MATRPTLESITRANGPDGAAHHPMAPIAKNREVCTNTTLAVIATIQAIVSKPDQSADLSAANCCYAFKRDPKYNCILTPLVGHATAPGDLWGEAMIFGVKELCERDVVKYIRHFKGLVKFQGASTLWTPSTTVDYPGIGPAPTIAKWAGCDVIGVTTLGLTSPGIMELHEATNSWASFAFDAWGCPWIEVYPSRSVPSGEAGSTATGISFWVGEA